MRPIYPIFLVTGLAIALLAGFTTGIIALSSAAMGWPGLGVNWLILVQTHGRIQLYGFAALFVFGVAYHVIPRFVAAPLRPSYGPLGTYVFTILGVGLSMFQIFGDERSFVVDHALFTVGLAFLVIAAVFYAVIIFATAGASKQPKELGIKFVQAAALWLVAGATIELVVGSISTPGQAILPQMEEPALAAVLVGFLVMTALGVSLRTLPGFLGLPKARLHDSSWLLGSSQFGVLGLVVGLTASGVFGWPSVGQPVAATGAAVLFAAVVSYIWSLRLFEGTPLPVAEMSVGREWARAVRLAYGWLIVGLALQAEALARTAMGGSTVPWNTMGAARHAIALGFVTLLIVGMASRVLPVFAGKRLWKAWLVDLATIFLVASALFRVVIETFAPYGTSFATDALLAASGPLALIGLVVFSTNIVVSAVRRERPRSIACSVSDVKVT